MISREPERSVPHLLVGCPEPDTSLIGAFVLYFAFPLSVQLKTSAICYQFMGIGKPVMGMSK
jgi:hypothetical protein